MTLRPPERTYSDLKDRKGLKDVDAAARAQKVKALGFALYAGLPMGLAAGFMMGHPIIGALVGPAILYTVVSVISGGAGKGAGVLYNPSGRTTPRKKEYSRAVALAARGEYKDAIIAYEAEILDDPAQAEPYLRIARIFRDELKDLEEALKWFARATRDAELSGGQEIRTRREMAEIYLHHKKEPRRAAPQLARLAESHPSTPDGQWAAAELARIKEEMAAEE